MKKTYSRLVALLQVLLLGGGGAWAQVPTGPDPVTLAESYLLHATESVRNNEPLEETQQWILKLEETAAKARPRNEAEAKTLAAILSEGQKVQADRKNEIEALMKRIEELVKQKKLNSARREANKAPRRKPEPVSKMSAASQHVSFDKTIEQIDKKLKDAAEYEKLGDGLAARGNCNDGPRVRGYYQKAKDINAEIDLSQKKIPGPCPVSTCGGKCKTTLVLLGMAAGTAAGFCVYDSRRGKSCLDRVR